MACASCDSPNVEIENQTEGSITSGWFQEVWRCQDCGAKGYIRGQAEAPAQQWTRTGKLFKGDEAV